MDFSTKKENAILKKKKKVASQSMDGGWVGPSDTNKKVTKWKGVYTTLLLFFLYKDKKNGRVGRTGQTLVYFLWSSCQTRLVDDHASYGLDDFHSVQQ